MDFLYEQFKLAFQNNALLQGGLILGILSVIGYKLRDGLLFIWNKIKILTIFSVYIDDSGMYSEFNKWYKNNYPDKFRSTEAKLALTYDILTKKYKSEINFTQFSDSNLIWYNNRLIYINKQRDTFSSATTRDNFYVNKYILKGFLARKAITNLLNEIGSFEIKIRAEKSRLEINFFEETYWTELPKSKCIIKKFDNLFFSNKNEIINILDNFKENYNKYFDLGLSHKTSILLYGPPGTGKSSICSAIANHLNYPIYSLNLASIEKDINLEKALRWIPSYSILLIEDIDRFLPDNNDKAKFNLGTLLNCLDGNASLSNCVVLMTTNYLEKLDTALIRSGRVDHKIEISYPSKENVEEFLSNYYKEKVSINNFDSTKTMSDIQSIALSNNLENCLKKIEINNKYMKATI